MNDPLLIRIRRPDKPELLLHAPGENLAAIMLLANDHFGTSWKDIGGPVFVNTPSAHVPHTLNTRKYTRKQRDIHN